MTNDRNVVIIGADVTHGTAARGNSSSIAAVRTNEQAFTEHTPLCKKTSSL